MYNTRTIAQQSLKLQFAFILSLRYASKKAFNATVHNCSFPNPIELDSKRDSIYIKLLKKFEMNWTNTKRESPAVILDLFHSETLRFLYQMKRENSRTNVFGFLKQCYRPSRHPGSLIRATWRSHFLAFSDFELLWSDLHTFYGFDTLMDCLLIKKECSGLVWWLETVFQDPVGLDSPTEACIACFRKKQIEYDIIWAVNAFQSLTYRIKAKYFKH